MPIDCAILKFGGSTDGMTEYFTAKRERVTHVALHQQANQLRYMVNDFREAISNIAEPRMRRKLDRRKKERRDKPASSLS